MSQARDLVDSLVDTTRSGRIIQVQRTQFTSTAEVTNSANTDTVVTDLTVNITPTSTSSIIKIEAMVNGEWGNMSAAADGTWFFYRDTTKLSHAAAGNRNVGVMMGTSITYHLGDQDSTPEHVYYSYFDSPSSTSQITYKVGLNNVNGAKWNLNKCDGDSSDTVSYERGISFICVTEIAG